MTWLPVVLLCLQAPQGVTLGAYSIDGKDVPAIVPSAPGPFTNAERIVELDDEKYLVSPEGRFVRHFRYQGGWSEVRDGYAKAKAAITTQTPEWRVKAFILPRSDILDVDAKGVARERRSIMEKNEIAHVGESLARFAAMAEAAGKGKIRVHVDMEIDSDTVFQNANAPFPFEPGFLNNYLTPRINGGLFEAEDRVYRGPYDSVFVIHAGLCGLAPTTMVSETPVSPLAFYAQGWPVGKEALSCALFDSWVEHLRLAAEKAGYSMPSSVLSRVVPTATEWTQGYRITRDPDSVFMGSMWGSVFAHEDVSTQAYMEHGGPPSAPPSGWDQIASDPFRKLPWISPEEIAKKMSAKALKVTAGKGILFESEGIDQPRSNLPFLADNRFEPGAEASAVLRYQDGARQITFVDPTYAGLFGKGMPSASEAKALGWFMAEGQALLVFDSKALSTGKPEASTLQISGFNWNSMPAVALIPSPSQEDAIPLLTPDGKMAANVPAIGGMIVTDAQEPDRGDVLLIRTAGLVRNGSILLAGQRNGPAIAVPESHPYLSFYMRPLKPEPMEIHIVPASGGADHVVRLFGNWPNPSEWQAPILPEVALSPGDGWQQVVLDLRKMGNEPVAAITLQTSRFAGYWPTKQAVPPGLQIDDLKVSKTAPATENALVMSTEPAANAVSPSSEARMLFAARAGEADAPVLVNLLKDPDDEVRLNAARAFQRIRNVAAETALADAIKTLDPRIAEACIDALAFQQTPGAWSAIEHAIKIGPFEFTREFAARAYAAHGDPKDLATLSLMLTCRSWRGRAYAAQGIAKIAKGQQQLVLMAFLIEVDPGVRLAATLGADMSVEDVCKRILWSAVNDPSDEIRAWSCLKLVQSGNPKYIAEGLKGVRDDSVGMRSRLLQLFRKYPNEAYRPALRIAVADTSPWVRAQALKAFAKLPGAVKAEEVENCLNDPDPRVKSALDELKKAKGFLGAR